MGWEVLLERLQPQSDDFDIIPWYTFHKSVTIKKLYNRTKCPEKLLKHVVSVFRLQITSVLTCKYSSTVPRRELVPLLSALHQLLAEQRRGERSLYVLRCLREVALCQARCPHKAQAHKAELDRLWARIWALGVRGVGSPHTESLSLDLLASIVHGGLVNVDREFWKLFSGSACKPSK